MLWFLRGRPQQRPKSTQYPSAENASQTAEVLMFRDREVQVSRRAYKRSIGITLQVNGRIRVSAPKSTPLSRIQEFLLSQAEWIETNLERYRSLRETYPPKRYFEGEEFLFLGEKLTLRFVCGTGARVRFIARDGDLICEIPSTEWAGFNPQGSHPGLGPALIQFYTKAGREIIGARLAHYAERMSLQPSSVCFRAQKTRWGSCSSRGRISLNWRLIVAPIEVIDYVVVHELSHLRHYDHSRSFWNLVASQVPQHSMLRQWLREHQYEADFLAKISELHP